MPCPELPFAAKPQSTRVAVNNSVAPPPTPRTIGTSGSGSRSSGGGGSGSSGGGGGGAGRRSRRGKSVSGAGDPAGSGPGAGRNANPDPNRNRNPNRTGGGSVSSAPVGGGGGSARSLSGGPGRSRAPRHKAPGPSPTAASAAAAAPPASANPPASLAAAVAAALAAAAAATPPPLAAASFSTAATATVAAAAVSEPAAPAAADVDEEEEELQAAASISHAYGETASASAATTTAPDASPSAHSAAPPSAAERQASTVPASTTTTTSGGGGRGGGMSWTCHGSSNGSMVDALKAAGLVRCPHVEAAMRAVDRALFVPASQAPYQDAPQPLGCGATISAPHMHAACLELLEEQLRPGARVLDVGSGSGYLTAVLAHMANRGPGARVVGVEHIAELVAASLAAARQLPWAEELLQGDTLRLVQGDGHAGYPGWAPFDAIHVGAAAPAVPPALVEQLAPGGRLVIPVGPEGGPQALVVVDKDAAGRVASRREMGVMYVPLTSERAQRGRAGPGPVWRGPQGPAPPAEDEA
ncbi:hypothetical protein HYH03_000778 [Edaphochlamys debaryana]|uniref:protein-L-isoaspartate(D-aspartate) O-methyltransferase n=1 Tax=Edaphochlamys debaryana TaxID=47281 RepID=A0A835YFT3_9CHLO|nr:hypothetical protein HYH03_000778 [Edaphochlamys debaryana]|eukprot:KAG2500954.1 hypothetical protein HYH03_000778 [Edaphochlamys debaryana]